MSRDFARSDSPRRGRSRSAPKSRPRSARGPFLIGLTLGLTVALGVYLVDHAYVSLDELLGEEGAASSPVPQAKSTARPRFDFYTILPEMEVVIPEEPEASGTPSRPAPVAAPAAAVTPPPAAKAGGYILQAGSFRSATDADGLKAQLALLGYQASVQTVTINQDTYHRVRVGPYADRVSADAARERLRANAVATMLLRLKG